MHNSKYLTVKESGIYIDGKNTVFYNGNAMVGIDSGSIKYIFNKIQQKIKDVAEVHIVASDTECPNNKHCITRDPSGAFGSNVWYRIKRADGKVSSWHFFAKYEGIFKNLSDICGPRACLNYLAEISSCELNKSGYNSFVCNKLRPLCNRIINARQR